MVRHGYGHPVVYRRSCAGARAGRRRRTARHVTCAKRVSRSGVCALTGFQPTGSGVCVRLPDAFRRERCVEGRHRHRDPVCKLLAAAPGDIRTTNVPRAFRQSDPPGSSTLMSSQSLSGVHCLRCNDPNAPHVRTLALAAYWWRCGRMGNGHLVCLRSTQHVQCCIDLFEPGSPAAVGKKAVMPHAHQAFRQDVQQEMPNELFAAQDHLPVPRCLPVILVAEGHCLFVDLLQTCIADGNAAGIPGQIVDHAVGVLQAVLAVNPCSAAVSRMSFNISSPASFCCSKLF